MGADSWVVYAFTIGTGLLLCYGIYRLGEYLDHLDEKEEARREAARPSRPNLLPPSQHVPTSRYYKDDRNGNRHEKHAP